MKKYIAKIALFSLVAAALVAVPATTRAEDTNMPAASTPKKHGLPFHGKVASVDAAAMTFTVGTMTLTVTSATKITKEGKPAVFSDVTVGEMITGAYKRDEAGKMDVTTLRIGAAGAKKDMKKASDGPPPTTKEN